MYSFSYYVDLLEFAHFSNLTWISPTIKTVQRLQYLIYKILHIIEVSPILAMSILHKKCLNRLFDVSGIIDASHHIPQLVSKTIQHNKGRSLLFGYESRQWGYQMLEMKRIYHLYSIFSAFEYWDAVKGMIKLINIKNYTANFEAFDNLALSLELDQINDLDSLKYVSQKNTLALNQWNLFSDLPILLHACPSTVKKTVDNINASQTCWTFQKDWLYNYMQKI